MTPGKIIFLNGTSSAGKTTLAHALQELLPEPFIHVALDQFRDGLPDKYRGLNAPEGTSGHKGLNVVPVTCTEKPFTAIKFGDDGRTLLRGMRRAMAAMVDEGNNIIIDDIVLEPEFLADYLEVFDGYSVVFVGVRCALSVINEREASRPGRFPGTAFGHFESCHQHGEYDIEVDTGANTPRQCAEAIVDYLASKKPRAFDILRAAKEE